MKTQVTLAASILSGIVRLAKAFLFMMIIITIIYIDWTKSDCNRECPSG